MLQTRPILRFPPAATRGFTLLEVLVTLAVAAILLGVAVPSYRGITKRNTVAARVNDLVGDLNYARSEAVTRNQDVYLCKASTIDPPACADSGDWSQGWIVYAPDPTGGDNSPTRDNLLRVETGRDDGITITGNTHIADHACFDANGFATGSVCGGISNGTFEVKTAGAVKKTKIVIAVTGRVRTQRTDAS